MEHHLTDRRRAARRLNPSKQQAETKPPNRHQAEEGLTESRVALEIVLLEHLSFSPPRRLAGFEKRSPYQLRHTFAFFSLRAGVPISDLAREMGHSNVSLTYETYGQWSDEMGQRAAALRSSWAKTQAHATNL